MTNTTRRGRVVRIAEPHNSEDNKLVKIEVLRRGDDERQSHWSADPDEADGYKWRFPSRPARDQD